MNEQATPHEPDVTSFGAAPRPPSRWRRWAAAGLVGGVVLGGAGVAIAATDTPTPSPSSPAAPGSEAPELRRPGGKLGFGPGGRHMHGPFGAVRGEFVVPNADGGYQTLAMQSGEVVSVSSSEIKVKSADGVEKTYAVTGETSVNGGRDGIGSVKTGDQVHVIASVENDKYTARRIVDEADVRRPFERFGPRRLAPNETSPSPATPS